MHSTEELHRFLVSIESHLPARIAEIQTTLSLSQKSALSLQDLIWQHLQQQGLDDISLDTENNLLSAKIAGSSSSTLLLYYHYNKHTDTAIRLLPLLVSLSTLALYHTLARPLPMTIKWLIDGHGTSHTEIQRRIQPLQADYILWTELATYTQKKPSLALGVKGFLKVSLDTEIAPTPLSSSYGAIVPNTAWRLIWALANLKDSHEEILIDGFYDTLIPASDQAIEQLYTLETPTPPEGMTAFLHQLQGFQLHYTHLLTPSCSITSLASQPTNQQEDTLLPQQAKARIDFYLVPEQDPDDILDKLQRHLLKRGFDDITLHKHSSSYPLHISIQHPFTLCLQHALKEGYGIEPILLPLSANTFPFATTPQRVPLLIQYIDLGQNLPNLKEGVLDEQKYASALKTLIFLMEKLSERASSLEPSPLHPKLPPKE